MFTQFLNFTQPTQAVIRFLAVCICPLFSSMFYEINASADQLPSRTHLERALDRVHWRSRSPSPPPFQRIDGRGVC